MNDLFEDSSSPFPFHPVATGVPEDPDHERSGRRAAREERERARRVRRRRLRTTAITLAILAGLGVLVWQVVLPQWDRLTTKVQESAPEDFPGPGHGEVEVVVASGATGSAMATVLYDAGVVASTQAFTDAFLANPAASGIQPGTYRLKLEMSGAGAVSALLDPGNRVVTRVTLPEGKNAGQILDILSGKTAIPVADFLTAMADTTATGLPVPSPEPMADEAPEDTLLRQYEGWLFAGTYSFEPGTTAQQMIAEMVARTVGHLDERGVAPEDRERVLILASLAEREAATAEDRAMVVQAIQNRLGIDMKLDIDAAVAYGLGISGTELTRELIDTSDNPYNLYRTTGLPPTPIASPSLESIDAALAPIPGPWLFWVTINLETKETRFAETLAEHNENVALYREWQAQQSAEPTEP